MVASTAPALPPRSAAAGLGPGGVGGTLGTRCRGEVAGGAAYGQVCVERVRGLRRRRTAVLVQRFVERGGRATKRARVEAHCGRVPTGPCGLSSTNRKLVPALGSLGSRQKHSLPDLPYDYGALEPHINAQIMQLHHSKHHAAYVNNLNATEDKYREALEKGRSGAGPGPGRLDQGKRDGQARLPKETLLCSVAHAACS